MSFKKKTYEFESEILELLIGKAELEKTIETLDAKVGTGTKKLDEESS